jgi:hypothetical protein
MGQTQPVSVFVLVTEATLEENLLSTLSAKRDLAMAALDPDSDVNDVNVRSQRDDIKQRLEVLLGAKPEAPVAPSAEESPSRAAQGQRLAEAGSAFLDAAFNLLGEVSGNAVAEEVRKGLDAKFVVDEQGSRRLSLAVPAAETLTKLARSLAALLSPPGQERPEREGATLN